MRKNISPAAGHTLCLTALLTVCSLALILVKAYMPAVILPRITYTMVIGLSLTALVLERWIFRSEEIRELLALFLLTSACFGVLSWAVGLADLAGAGRVGIVGGLVYTVCFLALASVRARLNADGVKHETAVLTLAAALLLLAAQSLAGIAVLG